MRCDEPGAVCSVMSQEPCAVNQEPCVVNSELCACVVSKLQGQRSQRKAASNKDMNTRMLSCFTAPFLHKGKPV